MAARYSSLLLLASGIQLAGPNLTPATFQAGLMRADQFPNPGARGAPYFQARVGAERLARHRLDLDVEPVVVEPVAAGLDQARAERQERQQRRDGERDLHDGGEAAPLAPAQAVAHDAFKEPRRVASGSILKRLAEHLGGILSASGAWLTVVLPPRAADEVFADPRAVLNGTFFPPLSAEPVGTAVVPAADDTMSTPSASACIMARPRHLLAHASGISGSSGTSNPGPTSMTVTVPTVPSRSNTASTVVSGSTAGSRPWSGSTRSIGRRVLPPSRASRCTAAICSSSR